VEGYYGVHMDRCSLQYLVNFLNNHHRRSHEEVVIMELKLRLIKLISDGGLDVLRNFFARSDTTLTKIIFDRCRFGEEEVISHFLSALYTNRTITDLSIRTINNLEGAALGNALSGLMQNMLQLQRLECIGGDLGVVGVRAFLPALRANRTLKLLLLRWDLLEDDEIHLIFDALVENTSVQELPNINPRHLGFATYTRIWNVLKRNEQLNHVASLLAPPPPPWQQQQQADIKLKVSHKATTRFATSTTTATTAASGH
jgi:hypothetical protein